MSAKAIVARYIVRNSVVLPSDSEKLRQHLAAVASGAGLRLTTEELDGLAPSPPAPLPCGEGRKKKRAVLGDLKAAGKKSSDTTSAKI